MALELYLLPLEIRCRLVRAKPKGRRRFFFRPRRLDQDRRTGEGEGEWEGELLQLDDLSEPFGLFGAAALGAGKST